MAQIPARVNTQSSVFPLLTQLSTQSVIGGQGEQTYVPNVNPLDQASPVMRGVAEAFYMHNVMPSTYGWQSVGFRELYPARPPVDFEDAQYIVSTDGISTYIAWDWAEAQSCFVIKDGEWRNPEGRPTGLTRQNTLSIATVNGVTYIAFAGIGVYTYNHLEGRLYPIELIGIDYTNMVCIVASNGYMLTFSKTGYVNSSSTDPTDFTPSLVSGANGGQLQAARGNIITAKATAYGVIAYTTGNAISIIYSGNGNFPFNATEIGGAGGVTAPWMVSEETNGTHYAYTTNGLQQVAHNTGKTILGYVTDFLSGGLLESFNTTTLQFELNFTTNPFRKKITVVNDRYVVMSYGLIEGQPMTHALVLDLVLTRMGKIKIDHTLALELKEVTSEIRELPRNSLSFIGKEGNVQLVDFSINDQGLDSVIFFGKYQYIRPRMINMQQVTVENANPLYDIHVLLFPTRDGKTFTTPVQGYLAPETTGGYVRNWYFDVEGINHSVCIAGSFNVIGMELYFQATASQRPT